MPLLVVYFELHQPNRTHPNGRAGFNHEQNRYFFEIIGKECYIPATEMFTQSVQENPHFKVTLSITGTLLEQAQRWGKGDVNLIYSLNKLYQAGQSNNHSQVEFLGETYYHSISGLFSDKTEFKEQVEMHSELMGRLFGFRPTAFRNTEQLYDNSIADAVSELGFKAMICGQNKWHSLEDKVYVANNTHENLFVLPRNVDLSNLVGLRFNKGVTADQYASYISHIPNEFVLLGYDYEHIGSHLKKSTGILDFWKYLPDAISRERDVDGKRRIVMVTPTDAAEIFERADNRPILDVGYGRTSWGPYNTDFAWAGSDTQKGLLWEVEQMKPRVENHPTLLKIWRNLTTSDIFFYMCPDYHCQVFNPYGNVEGATNVLRNRINHLNHLINVFERRGEGVAQPVEIEKVLQG